MTNYDMNAPLGSECNYRISEIHDQFNNEILANARIKSAVADEICFADENKPTLSASSRISSPQGDFIIEDDFTHLTGWI